MNQRNFMAMMAAAILLLGAQDVFAGRESCYTTLYGSEVIVASKSSSICGWNLNYYIEDIAVVPANGSGEKIVCGGFRLPNGYTVKRRELSTNCASQKGEALVWNRPPVSKIYALTTSINTPVSAYVTTTDPDNDPLTYSTYANGRSAGNGQIQLDSTTGYVTYTPPSTMGNANDYFSVFVTDGKSDPVTVQVEIKVGTGNTGGNQNPVISIYEIFVEPNMYMDFPVSGYDPDGDIISIELNSARPPQHGTAVPVLYGNRTLYRYTPAPGYIGNDLVGFKANDGKGGIAYGEIPIRVDVIDFDNDGLPRWFENSNGLSDGVASDALLDPDMDGLNNLGEFRAGTKLTLADTDGDAIPDGYEVNQGRFNPLQVDAHLDFDGDGYTNLDEYVANTNPNNAGDTPAMPMAAWLIPVLSLLH